MILREPELKDTDQPWSDQVQQDTSSLFKSGSRYILGTLAVFGVWAMLAPLSSSVVANGRVMAAAQNQLLQHPSGGVVRRIVAQDGAYLKAGDLVVEIDPEASRAELARLKSRYDLLTAQKARFEAEKNKLFPVSQSWGLRSDIMVLPRPKNSVSSNVASAPSNVKQNPSHIEREQNAEFQARMDRFTSELSSLENQSGALKSEYAGLQPQILNQTRLVKLQKEQLEKTRPLVRQQYFSKARFTQMEVGYLDAKSRLTLLQSQSQSTTARIAEVEDRITQLKASRKEEYSRELTNLHSELAGITEQIKAAEKALSYTQLRAPVDGVLVKLTANTVGGVISPGEVVGEIVPKMGGVMVEARIQPKDVASIEVGQEAEIVVSSFNRRLIDPFEATVDYVAADSQMDQLTGESYFAVRLSFDDAGKLQSSITPGMPAESYIQLGSRSFVGYLFKPLSDSFRKAFQER